MAQHISPVLNGCNQAIWQAKVAPDVQGRVFTARLVIAWLAQPISLALAGPLVDLVLEPAMARGGGLALTFGWLVGTGAGSGMGLLLVAAGLAMALVGIGGYQFAAVRNAEDILPDHDHLSRDAES
jgi:DHA3 family macrolide efflux protein-like MFS transporter